MKKTEKKQARRGKWGAGFVESWDRGVLERTSRCRLSPVSHPRLFPFLVRGRKNKALAAAAAQAKLAKGTKADAKDTKKVLTSSLNTLALPPCGPGNRPRFTLLCLLRFLH
jgi:hypothetical protein